MEKLGKIFLSGRISGVNKSVVKANFEKQKSFFEDQGYIVLNPLDIKLTEEEIVKGLKDCETVHITLNDIGIEEPLVWQSYMRRAITLLCQADYISFVEGSEVSIGSQVERQIAESIGIPEWKF